MVQQLDAVFLWTTFLAGILSFFSPCILPLLPVYTGILMEETGDKAIKIGRFKIYTKPVYTTLAFVFGISTVFITLGFGASFLGKLIASPYTPIIMGIIVIILGLHHAEYIHIPFLERQKSTTMSSNKNHLLNAYLLGFTFSFGWTPCIGPVLSAIFALSSSGGSNSLLGVMLMAVYALGLALPFMCISLASTLFLKHIAKVKKYMLRIKKVGGWLIILMGVLLIFGQANFLSTLFH
ncbi:cytochrome c biogenesis protein CcdA [Granulicatella sp. zg-ZJ]|uniref:cytochrome c biogenesis protein CcdA n=1 Tax=unclassified Granulicatella TaxID=2630493 RepID=UPI0013BF8813|nr:MULTISPECIES: cytochrome c biogenesis CcdA family protein [unclassified Granulicatella]MBS4751020.1 cytochrome c biogenesis protein CcdA [Carnobacteriaceae bacterium zg-ZUI78]NEW62832.1 cytochrome c biogenesis protein CcdA [Granulicatella sp. zg-ZJ]NEW65476.1 cytochrome c biogenesis protein CcdA [Granulicatella sp. zg-84]QMI85269.1 cytochrome c biogenesis protein CcdA [Carnobacteriaceae bacterium zg-84]